MGKMYSKEKGKAQINTYILMNAHSEHYNYSNITSRRDMQLELDENAGLCELMVCGGSQGESGKRRIARLALRTSLSAPFPAKVRHSQAGLALSFQVAQRHAKSADAGTRGNPVDTAKSGMIQTLTELVVCIRIVLWYRIAYACGNTEPWQALFIIIQTTSR